MILRIDKIAVPLPVPESPDPNGAAAVQELMGGKFGEMSTLMNYTFQSFNFRGREKLRPFYDLISNIAAEEYSHIETVSAAINLMLTGATTRADRRTAKGKAEHAAPLANAIDSGILIILSRRDKLGCLLIRWATRGRASTSFRAEI
jgi:Mn-containing catalase